MENTKPVIGFDLDDVLFDFMGPLNEWHNQTYGAALKMKDYFSYDLDKVWQCEGQEAVDRVWNFYQTDHHKNSQPISGALEGLRELKQHYTFVIVTARPETLEKPTREWLDMHFPGMFDEVIFTNHFFDAGVKRTKSSVCVEIGAKVFIEDALHNAEDIAGAGIPVLLFDTPWNREVVSELITRVHSWKEVIEKIR